MSYVNNNTQSLLNTALYLLIQLLRGTKPVDVLPGYINMNALFSGCLYVECADWVLTRCLCSQHLRFLGLYRLLAFISLYLIIRTNIIISFTSYLVLYILKVCVLLHRNNKLCFFGVNILEVCRKRKIIINTYMLQLFQKIMTINK